MADDVVITGVGIASPIGCDEASFWDSLCQGRPGVSPVDNLDTSELTRKLACQVRSPLDAPSKMGRASRLAVSAARQAVASSHLDRDALPADRSDVIIGTTMGETQFIEDRLGADASEWLGEDHLGEIARGRPGCIAGAVQADLGLAGTSMDLYGACAAGNMAIGMARHRLIEERCDLALVGGADGFSRLAFIGFMRLRIMASEVCRPFDEERDGLFVAEGGTVFVLERESQARARGAPIRARVLGCGIAGEDYHPTRPDPNGDGLTRATQAAMHEAGTRPEDIDYVCAHGTGTPQNDAIEVKVMARCFPKGVRFSSIKALTGHPMGAASALEAAACILSLEHQTLIPTWHLTKVLQPCDLDPIKDAPRPARVECVINNSAGFGGYNSSVVLARA